MKRTSSCSLLRPLRGCLLAGVASLLLPQSTAFGSNITWGASTSGDWAVGSNWTGGTAPADSTTTDRAYFDSDGAYTVSLTADRSVNRLYVTGNANPKFDFSGYTLTMGSFVSIQGGSTSLVGGAISTTIWYQGNKFSNSTFALDGATASVTAASGGYVGFNDNETAATASDSNTLTVKNGATFTANSSFGIGQISRLATPPVRTVPLAATSLK